MVAIVIIVAFLKRVDASFTTELSEAVPQASCSNPPPRWSNTAAKDYNNFLYQWRQPSIAEAVAPIEPQV